MITPDLTKVHGFQLETENFGFVKQGYHAKADINGSRVVQISAS